MVNWFKNNVFELFGKDYKRRDTYKNENDEGLQERFSQTLSTSLDDLTDNSITKLLDNIYVPTTLHEKLLTYLEYNLGITLYLGEDNRRKVIKNITKYYQIKGTQRCYDVLFNVLGLDNTIITEGTLSVTQFDSEGVLDSGLVLDNTGSTFNLTCLECVAYSVDLTGSLVLTDNITRAIFSILLFNEPINYKLQKVTYNGTTIGSPNTYIAISSDGRLKYSDTGFIVSHKG